MSDGDIDTENRGAGLERDLVFMLEFTVQSTSGPSRRIYQAGFRNIFIISTALLPDGHSKM